jgi:hypothetical protein
VQLLGIAPPVQQQYATPVKFTGCSRDGGFAPANWLASTLRRMATVVAYRQNLVISGTPWFDLALYGDLWQLIASI